MNENKYASRKFIITMLGMSGAIICAYFGILTLELSNVLLAGIASYNVANSWIHKKGEA